MDVDTIAERIRELRRYRGYTTKYLGIKVNLSEEVVEEIENGNLPILNDKIIKDFAEALGCTEDYLLGNTDSFEDKKYHPDSLLTKIQNREEQEKNNMKFSSYAVVDNITDATISNPEINIIKDNGKYSAKIDFTFNGSDVTLFTEEWDKKDEAIFHAGAKVHDYINEKLNPVNTHHGYRVSDAEVKASIKDYFANAILDEEKNEWNVIINAVVNDTRSQCILTYSGTMTYEEVIMRSYADSVSAVIRDSLKNNSNVKNNIIEEW